MSENIVEDQKHHLSDELYEFLRDKGVKGIGKVVSGYAVGANDSFVLFISPINVDDKNGGKRVVWQMRMKVFNSSSSEDRIRKPLQASNPSDAYIEAMSKLSGYCKAYNLSEELTVLNHPANLPPISKDATDINYLSTLPMFDNIDMDVLLPKAAPKKIKPAAKIKKFNTPIPSYKLSDGIIKKLSKNGFKLAKIDKPRRKVIISMDDMYVYELYQHRYVNGMNGTWELQVYDKNGTQTSRSALGAIAKTLDIAVQVAWPLVMQISKLWKVYNTMERFDYKKQIVDSDDMFAE